MKHKPGFAMTMRNDRLRELEADSFSKKPMPLWHKYQKEVQGRLEAG
jgi:hypothetical protein